jgi:glutaredoxin
MAQVEPVDIYGKDECGFTSAARKDYATRGREVRYFDVKKDAAAMARFLELGEGQRRVPLILDRGRVSIGYGGS